MGNKNIILVLLILCLSGCCKVVQVTVTDPELGIEDNNVSCYK